MVPTLVLEPLVVHVDPGVGLQTARTVVHLPLRVSAEFPCSLVKHIALKTVYGSSNCTLWNKHKFLEYKIIHIKSNFISLKKSLHDGVLNKINKVVPNIQHGRGKRTNQFKLFNFCFLEKPGYSVEGASEEDSPFENFNCSYGFKNTCIIIQNFSSNKHVLCENEKKNLDNNALNKQQ